MALSDRKEKGAVGRGRVSYRETTLERRRRATSTSAPRTNASAPSPHVVRPGTPGGTCTVVTSVTESLPAVGSGGLAAETLAVLEMVPNSTGAVTVMVNCTDAAFASEAIVHVTVTPEAAPQPAPEETKVTDEGKVSVTVTVAAVSGPLLVTVMVYVRDWPASTVVGFADLAIVRSAPVAVVRSVTESFEALGSVVLDVTVAVFEIVPPALGP